MAFLLKKVDSLRDGGNEKPLEPVAVIPFEENATAKWCESVRQRRLEKSTRVLEDFVIVETIGMCEQSLVRPIESSHDAARCGSAMCTAILV
jgi:hypothetical protein